MTTEMVDIPDTLKRKASPSPPAQDVAAAPKRARAVDPLGGGVGDTEKVNDDGTGGPTNNGSASKRHDEPMDDASPSPSQVMKPLKKDTGSSVNVQQNPSSKEKSAAASAVNGNKSPIPARNSPANNTSRPGSRRNIDEKKRVQRLFGGLLSTLSQSASSSQQKRRQELELRQQERLKRQTVEGDRRRAEKLAARREAWSTEQDNLEEEIMHARHSKMLALAHSLRTRSEPRLYYQPYQLTESQERIIEGQVSNAKDLIEKDLRELRRRKGETPTNNRQSQSRRAESGQEGFDDGASSPKPKEPTVGERKNSLQDTNRGGVVSSAKDDHDGNGDVMVQDKEDTVLY